MANAEAGGHSQVSGGWSWQTNEMAAGDLSLTGRPPLACGCTRVPPPAFNFGGPMKARTEIELTTGTRVRSAIELDRLVPLFQMQPGEIVAVEVLDGHGRESRQFIRVAAVASVRGLP
jgi:hypothetical protein